MTANATLSITAVALFWIFVTGLTLFGLSKFLPNWSQRKRLIVASLPAPAFFILPAVMQTSFSMIRGMDNGFGVVESWLALIPHLVGALVVMVFGLIVLALVVFINFSVSWSISKILRLK